MYRAVTITECGVYRTVTNYGALLLCINEFSINLKKNYGAGYFLSCGFYSRILRYSIVLNPSGNPPICLDTFSRQEGCATAAVRMYAFTL